MAPPLGAITFDRGRRRSTLGELPRALLEVLVDAARHVREAAAIGDGVDVVADALDEVAVMADHDERARPAVEQILERGQRVDVEIVRRLVEQQHVGLGHHQPHQLEPAPFAAREIGDERPLPVADEAEALAQLRCRQLAAVAERDAGAHRLERLEHALASDELLEVLRQGAEPDGRSTAHLTARRLELAGEQT